ncbi:SDR family oxidoreductase [Flavobacterium sp. J372]|uniref:SDR family oxidoreductase n=1 Tax=Flavobacterium sp. J372 TaxID=2898436 RepID=UPI002151DC94|nr:SDR family oxidoreductase [Flavobacterium sp. J372]MCR5862034.1 SDR family oxidoreductase [Flavobacterium sp. J372]
MNKNHLFTALVTGGSSGIGKAIALKLAEEKYKVVNADVIEPAYTHCNIRYISCDVSKSSDVTNLFTSVKNDLGTLGILVLNAGKGNHELLAEGDPEKWQDVVNLNIMGTLRCIRAFVPQMLENKKGDVVIISSVSSGKAHTYGGVYSASKAAIDMISETLRIETEPHIRVTTVKPGTAATGFFKNSGRKDYYPDASLTAENIAEDVWYAINKPPGTSINTIVTRPTGQLF